MKLQKIIDASEIKKLAISQIGEPVLETDIHTGKPIENSELDGWAERIAISHNKHNASHYMCAIEGVFAESPIKKQPFFYAFVFYGSEKQ